MSAVQSRPQRDENEAITIEIWQSLFLWLNIYVVTFEINNIYMLPYNQGALKSCLCGFTGKSSSYYKLITVDAFCLHRK